MDTSRSEEEESGEKGNVAGEDSEEDALQAGAHHEPCLDAEVCEQDLGAFHGGGGHFDGWELLIAVRGLGAK